MFFKTLQKIQLCQDVQFGETVRLDDLRRPFQLYNSVLFKVSKGFNAKKIVLEHNSPVTEGVWVFAL